MLQWKVRLTEIVWDDGGGEYDVSQLPSALELIVIADDQIAAEEFAMDEASEDHGSLIMGTTAHATPYRAN